MPEITEKQEFSKTLFGRRDRLAVWGHVLNFTVEPPEIFCCLDIEEALRVDNIPRTVAYQEVIALRDLGMIALAPEQHRDSKDYHRVEGPGWEMVEAALRLADEVITATEAD